MSGRVITLRCHDDEYRELSKRAKRAGYKRRVGGRVVGNVSAYLKARGLGREARDGRRK